MNKMFKLLAVNKTLEDNIAVLLPFKDYLK